MSLTGKDVKVLRELFELILEEKGVVTREDIKHIPSKVEFHGKMDEVVGELKNWREEKDVLFHQVSRNNDRIYNIEKHLKITLNI